MSNLFFEKPILNSPYEYPARHWEFDKNGQPAQRIDHFTRESEQETAICDPNCDDIHSTFRETFALNKVSKSAYLSSVQ